MAERKIHIVKKRNGKRESLCQMGPKVGEPLLTGDPNEATCEQCKRYMDQNRGRGRARIVRAPEGALTRLFKHLRDQWMAAYRGDDEGGPITPTAYVTAANMNAVQDVKDALLELSMADREGLTHALRTLVELVNTVAGDTDVDANWISNTADRLETAELIVFQYDGRTERHPET